MSREGSEVVPKYMSLDHRSVLYPTTYCRPASPSVPLTPLHHLVAPITIRTRLRRQSS